MKMKLFLKAALLFVAIHLLPQKIFTQTNVAIRANALKIVDKKFITYCISGIIA
jgi:hypothetical protein